MTYNRLRGYHKITKEVSFVTRIDFGKTKITRIDLEGIIKADVNNTVLMRPTTKVDKNGVRIYEGDIIKTVRGYCGSPHHITSVRYEEVKENDDGSFFSFPADIVEIEVVGNIYENPELLGKVIKADEGEK
jgi:uncharacterized phage protein (TIGR01671 family)